MSAALRELRPVEIVGLYEDVLEGFQVPYPTIVLGCVTHWAYEHIARKGTKALLRVSPCAAFQVRDIGVSGNHPSCL